GVTVRRVMIVDQGGDRGVHAQNNIAAAAAVAAIGTAQGLELLPVDRGDAIAPVARAQVQRHAVNKAGDLHLVTLPFDMVPIICRSENKRGSPQSRTTPVDG